LKYPLKQKEKSFFNPKIKIEIPQMFPILAQFLRQSSAIETIITTSSHRF